MQNIVSDYLSSNGFAEIMCNSLTKGGYYEKLTTFPEANSVKILNPLSNELNVLRQTLLFGGLESIQRNTNFRNPNLKLYEFGNCYVFKPEVKSQKPLDKYSEHFAIGIWLTGENIQEHWMTKPEKQNFFHLKGYVHSVLKRFGFDIDRIDVTEAPEDIYAYGLTYKAQGKHLVTFGMVNPELLKQFDIKADVFFAEIIWKPLMDMLAGTKIQYQELPKFPEVRRDLALLIDSSVKYEQIRKLAFETERKLLKSVNLFDVYQGKNIPEGKKSYAISYILQDETKTLTDEQIDKTMKRLIDVYVKELGAQLR